MPASIFISHSAKDKEGRDIWDVRAQRLIGTTYSRAPFISGRVGASGRVYAFDASGQAWVLEVKDDATPVP